MLSLSPHSISPHSIIKNPTSKKTLKYHKEKLYALNTKNKEELKKIFLKTVGF